MIDPRRLALIIALTLVLFVLDYSLPLGVATGMLYACLLFLTAPSTSQRFLLIAASTASVLIVIGGRGTL